MLTFSENFRPGNSLFQSKKIKNKFFCKFCIFPKLKKKSPLTSFFHIQLCRARCVYKLNRQPSPEVTRLQTTQVITIYFLYEFINQPRVLNYVSRTADCGVTGRQSLYRLRCALARAGPSYVAAFCFGFFSSCLWGDLQPQFLVTQKMSLKTLQSFSALQKFHAMPKDFKR